MRKLVQSIVTPGPGTRAEGIDTPRGTIGAGRPHPRLAPLDVMGVERLPSDGVGRVVRGIDVAAHVAGAHAALVDESRGALVAVAERSGGRWQPRVVMHEPADA